MDTIRTHKPSERLLWMDLEMTGLDPELDPILEVAAIVTDWQFTEIATFEGIIHVDDRLLKDRILANRAFWDKHEKSRDALFAQNEAGKGSSDVESDILAFIHKHFSDDAPVLLAGNSIHIDRRFITAQWPRLESRLHYRMLDVTAWKVVFEGKFKKKFTKAEEHRALGDIRGSISEVQYYLSKVSV